MVNAKVHFAGDWLWSRRARSDTRGAVETSVNVQRIPGRRAATRRVKRELLRLSDTLNVLSLLPRTTSKAQKRGCN